MKVLALASYPIEAAATRYRLAQFKNLLANRGIEMTIHPFLDSHLFEQLYQGQARGRNAIGLLKSACLRLGDLQQARMADVVFIQREAMIFGPPIIEWLMTKALKKPIVLDLDDATYVSYTSPTYGRLGKALKWFSKTDDLIGWSTIVTCGNRSIAEYVSSKGKQARVIPTVVDTELFRPVQRREDSPVTLGWIGTHSTFPYVESILPVLQDLARHDQFRLKIVGAGKQNIIIRGVEVENLPWQLDREIEDFQSIDIGLYPIDARLYSNKWAAGKSGFKAIQYMSVGIPFVATPVGASAEIGEDGVTHFFASSPNEWREKLDRLINDATLRKRMGTTGREHAVKHFALDTQADKLAEALQEAFISKRS